MKKSILILIAVLYVGILPVLSQADEAQLYQKKIQTYNRMQKAGWTMTGIGGGLAMTGTVLLFTVDDDFWDDDVTIENESDEDAVEDVFQAIGGIVCLSIGIGLVAGGVTLGSIGSHKVRSYQHKLDNLSIGMILTPKTQGLTLTYRF